MERRINSKLLLVGVISILLTLCFTVFALYQSFNIRIKDEVKKNAQAIKIAYEKTDDIDDLKILELKQLRATIIDSEGNVVFDNSATGQLDNHIKRPEVASAIENGEGEDTRTSKTLGLKLYYYALRLDDGNILRVSTNVETLYSAFVKVIPVLLLISVITLFVLVMFSKRLTKSIMKPIEKMVEDIENIEDKVPYSELEPFVNAIVRQQSKKRENEKIRQEFTANVSHELKTPLTSISGYAEIIENGIAKEEDIKIFAGKIRTESGRLIHLIGDIIKLSEYEEPIDKIRTFETVDLYKIALEIKEILAFNASKNNISIIIDGENPCEVFGDRSMLSEMLYNLCDNSVKYNKPGGSVKISLLKSENKTKLSVTDTGIGIAKGYQERIFERFYRVDKSRSKETGGTGLGLAIVKHIAFNHDAQITVFSDIDKGTQINVVFNS